MRRWALALAVASFVADPALALSCAPWSPVLAFRDAQAESARYVVVVGRVTLAEGGVPQHAGQAPAHVRGRGLSFDGFETPFSADITLDITCAGPWCGGLAVEAEQLVFLEKSGRGYRLRLAPCAPMAFPNPDAEDLAQMTACLRGEACEPPEDW